MLHIQGDGITISVGALECNGGISGHVGFIRQCVCVCWYSDCSGLLCWSRDGRCNEAPFMDIVLYFEEQKPSETMEGRKFVLALWRPGCGPGPLWREIILSLVQFCYARRPVSQAANPESNFRLTSCTRIV